MGEGQIQEEGAVGGRCEGIRDGHIPHTHTCTHTHTHSLLFLKYMAGSLEENKDGKFVSPEKDIQL